ncbi:HIG1 domain family member 1A, mitochondrial-like [Neocloeon triangulifer]|uniref:HIG1 domain family member 1A, mitochondrial-like n=1 Tax=Neocloeon triangulifer TaxID=2078957 RepID=UPI00286EFE6A|nr:HIG1 domain family member 1A, mitochondrial-like [Neocloeon triangulifer]
MSEKKSEVFDPTFSGAESQSGRLRRKMEEAPLFPIGILGCLAAVGYGAYSYKNRGKMSTSVFLMQLRVTAQGAVVVCLTAGIGYSLFKDFLLPKIDKKD